PGQRLIVGGDPQPEVGLAAAEDAARATGRRLDCGAHGDQRPIRRVPGSILAAGPYVTQLELLILAVDERDAAAGDVGAAEGVVGQALPLGMRGVKEVFDAVEERIQEAADPRDERDVEPDLQVLRNAIAAAEHRAIALELQYRLNVFLIGRDFVDLRSVE